MALSAAFIDCSSAMLAQGLYTGKAVPPEFALTSGAMLELRKHPRVSLTARVAVIALDSTFYGEVHQIGAGGLSARCAGRLSVSQPVELQFALPEGPEVRIAAVVWWKRDGLVGFRFDLSGSARSAVETWVKQRIEQAEYFKKPI